MIPVIMEIHTDFLCPFQTPDRTLTRRNQMLRDDDIFSKAGQKTSKQRRTAPFLSVGSKGGTVVRALAFHQCGPGSNPGLDTICGLSLLLVLSLAPKGFSPGTPVFSSPQKPTVPNSNSTRNQVDEEPLYGCTTCKSLFIYLFIYICYSFTFDPDT